MPHKHNHYALRLLSGFCLMLTVAPILAQQADYSQPLQQLIQQGRMSGWVSCEQHPHGESLTFAGSANIDAQQPMQERTIFRIASLTKTITATALMQFVAQGRCSIEDPISKYIPAFQNLKLADGTPVRTPLIREILTHTAGLAPASEVADSSTLAEHVDALAKLPLRFEPGSRWQYSSGLDVAGRIVEILAEKPFENYLQSAIFQPLDMPDTAFQLTPQQAERLAVLYQPGEKPGTLQAAKSADPTIRRRPNPSGGLYSTAGDLRRFYWAVLNTLQGQQTPLGLPQAVVQNMLTPHTGSLETGFTPGNAWGLGWCIVQQPQGVTRLLSPGTFGHGGAFGTQAWIDPQRGLVTVLMIQRSGFGNSDGSEIRDAYIESALRSFSGPQHPGAQIKAWHGHQLAVELTLGNTRAVLAPETGGRVLEYAINGRNSLYLDEREQDWKPGMQPLASAGRFDFGPELVVPKHSIIWSGHWTAEITGPHSARLLSERDPQSGVQLIREFSLVDESASAPENSPKRWAGATLVCRQVLMNISDKTVEYCHWGRSFHPSNGICIIPLGTNPSRFPSKYVMYEEDGGINPKTQDPQIRERDGVLEITGPPRRPKLGFDSCAGWLAFAMTDNRLFVKRFPTYPDRVYNEAAALTISVWWPQSKMIELEPIGPRERIQPGQSASFTETWSIADLPYPKPGEQLDLARIRQLAEPEATPATGRP